MWRYYTLRLLEMTLRRLPSVLGIFLINVFADIAHLFSKQSRSTIELNLHHTLGDSVDPKLLRQSSRETHRNNLLNYYDLVRVPHVTVKEIEERVEFDGVEYFEEAHSYGKGVLLASAHIGNLDLVLQSLLGMGLDVTILAERLVPPKLHDYVMSLRMAHGLTYEVVDFRGLKAAFRTLEQGEYVGIACDRAIQGKGIVTDFLGEPALMPVGAAELALRTGATILPLFVIRTGRDRYKVFVEPPIRVTKGDANPDRVRELTDQIVNIIERYVKEYPTQWMSFQNVWEPENWALRTAKELVADKSEVAEL